MRTGGRLRVGVASFGDPTAVTTWSGIPAHVCRALAELGHEVVPIPTPAVPGEATYARLVAARNRLAGSIHSAQRDRWLARARARRLDATIAQLAPDLVLSLGSLVVSYSSAPVPLVIWADAVLPQMLGYYPEFDTWTKHSVRAGLRAERSAVRAATSFVAASAWTLDSARRHYGDLETALVQVPFGANLPAVPAPSVRVAGDGSAVRLLSVGAYWERKGLDVALEASILLRARGIEATLDLVGAAPPPGTRVPPFVTVHGFLSKQTAEGYAKLNALYAGADVFVLPTKAECFGIVFCEAAAHGLPVIAPRTGGVPSAVLDGETGVLLSEDADSAEYANAVESLLRDPAAYERLSKGAREVFETSHNWVSATEAVLAAAGMTG